MEKDNKYEKFVQIRHDLHSIPEKSSNEVKTTEMALKIINTFINHEKCSITKLLETGFTVDLAGSKPSTGAKLCIAIRAAIDGIMLDEQNKFDYKSTIKGNMHACGHEGQTTQILAALETILLNLDKIPETFGLKFIFQPSVESGNGAAKLIDAGVLKGVNEIYGFHNDTSTLLGEIQCKKGEILARTDTINIKVTGKGGHGSVPHLSRSPINASVTLISILENIIEYEVNAKEISSIVFSSIESGATPNVIPNDAYITGNMVNGSEDTAEFLIQRLNDVAKGTGKLTRTTIDVSVIDTCPVTVNSDDQAQAVIDVAKKYYKFADDKLPSLYGDNFSYYLKKIPGSYFIIGTGDDSHTSAIHTDTYDFNDKAIEIGADMLIHLIEAKAGVTII